MHVSVYDDKLQASSAAAADGAERIRQAIAARGRANIVVATGASQFDLCEQLALQADLNWNRVSIFHLDEYCGLPISHPASFRLYLWERFVRRLPVPPAAFYPLNGEGDAAAECERVGAIIRQHPVDVAFVGIGENGHLAFNDPPADFHVEAPYHVVQLDEDCRRQQYDEGWFASLEQVPRQALSMSIRQIMTSRAIICTVPDERKARAVAAALQGPVSPEVPASILQTHEQATVYLDQPAASLLTGGDGVMRRIDAAASPAPPRTAEPTPVDQSTVR